MRVVETFDRVGDGKPVFRSRFRFRAEHEALARNRLIAYPSFRYEVVREMGRWCVVAMQNVAQS